MKNVKTNHGLAGTLKRSLEQKELQGQISTRKQATLIAALVNSYQAFKKGNAVTIQPVPVGNEKVGKGNTDVIRLLVMVERQ